MMQCHPQTGHGECQCVCSNLWSTAKKIRVLQEKLKTLDEKKSEIKTLISELEAEK